MTVIKLSTILMGTILLIGCATIPASDQKLPVESAEVVSNDPVFEPAEITLPPEAAEAQIGDEGVIEEEVIPLGKIFAKTFFEGVVQASYVELSIVDQNDESKIYQLIIGDKARQKSFPWKAQTVKPGYFFVELPVGDYKIQSIAIPVGTTKAIEPMSVIFSVKEDMDIYLGTLKVFGTKEKIKLGGVPVIKPGFEYQVEVIDERFEAFEEIQTRFAQSTDDIEVDLMRVLLRGNSEVPQDNP